jgi:superfamily II DNA helicase RecQ
LGESRAFYFLVMPIRIFTLPFNEETQTFHDDLVQQFCLNKRIHRIETRFFSRNNQPFWTVAIHYGVILEEDRKNAEVSQKDTSYGLDDQQKALLVRLKELRRETADKLGLPVYLIATNAHLAQMILQKCTTLESLKLVKGFGAARIEKYGKLFSITIQNFYHST